MVRWIVLSVVVVGLTAVATYVVQYIPDSDPEARSAVNTATGPQPKVAFEEDLVYDFGKMAQRDERAHAWKIKNLGEANLEIWQEGNTSCSCTVAEFSGEDKKEVGAAKKKVTVKPGESTKINLVWKTKEFQDKYNQSATIGTNDPSRPIFTIGVTGFVHQPVVAIPPQLVTFEAISNEEPTKGKLAVFSPDRQDMKIKKITTSRPALIVASSEPMPADDLKLFKVNGGYKVDVVIKPGLPLGRFADEVIIETDHPLQPELRVALGGTVTGPISVIPAGLRMPRVSNRKSSSRELRILVRGGRETTFAVLHKPDKIEVEVKPSASSSKGDYRLVVTVPVGTQAGRIDDHIILKTDHPRAGEIRIPVSIFVSNSLDVG
jgi:hypothetical protein